MAPQTKSDKTKQKKRNKVVMNLADKLKILDLLKSGERVSVIAKRFQVNESTIRSIRQNEDKFSHSKLKSWKRILSCREVYCSKKTVNVH